MNPDVGDATPVEGDEKLPKVTGLKLLNVQEASLETSEAQKISVDSRKKCTAAARVLRLRCRCRRHSTQDP